jgi:hypothetical protein
MADNIRSNLGDKLGIVEDLVTQYSSIMLTETRVIHVAVLSLITYSMLSSNEINCRCVGVIAYSH